MEVLRSNVNPRSEAYQGNRTAFLEQLDKLDKHLATRAGGGEKYTSATAAGKLLPRERIELLLDRDSYFLELCAARRQGRPVTRRAPSSAASARCRASSA